MAGSIRPCRLRNRTEPPNKAQFARSLCRCKLLIMLCESRASEDIAGLLNPAWLSCTTPQMLRSRWPAALIFTICVLSRHRRPNLGEYEGNPHIGVRIVEDMITATRHVAATFEMTRKRNGDGCLGS